MLGKLVVMKAGTEPGGSWGEGHLSNRENTWRDRFLPEQAGHEGAERAVSTKKAPENEDSRDSR